MKFHWLTFTVAALLTGLMLIIAVTFDYYKESMQDSGAGIFWGILICCLIVLVSNYFIIQSLFNYYGKKQVRSISTILPDEIVNQQEETMTLENLGKKVFELQQKKDTMTEMETYRKEYIGNVSHELKTPLFSIQGYVETLIDGGVENLNVRDKYLVRISNSVERLLTIVKDLDMINQYESGEISLNLSVFDINLVIKETMELLEMEAARKYAILSQQTTVPQLFVLADKEKIFQVLINLVSNAIHYSNREQAKINIKTEVSEGKILVQVIDNGMGIKPEALPRIFERFYRVESSRNRKDGGSGLGLAIVKHILEAHGTKILVESQYLEGTTFSFLLDTVL